MVGNGRYRCHLPLGEAAESFSSAQNAGNFCATRLVIWPWRWLCPRMLVGVGWSLLVGGDSLAFYLSLAASWWLGGLTMLVMVPRLRMQTLVWATAVTFPIAIWLTMKPLFFGLGN